MFGTAVVYILLVSENIENLLSHVHVHVSFCYWCMIVTAAVTPFTWFGTPTDFW
jgi:vesicular inhibitory amino acid transporter